MGQAGTDLEVVDQRLHALLHGRTRRRHELVVVNLDSTGGHLVQTLVSKTRVQNQVRYPNMPVTPGTHLVDDAERLPELLYTAEVPVVAVTVLTHWHIELNLEQMTFGA